MIPSDIFFSANMPHWFGTLLPMLFPLMLLDLVLRGMALWRAGRNNQLAWFIALLIVNSVGILPAIYLIFFDEGRKAQRGKGAGGPKIPPRIV